MKIGLGARSERKGPISFTHSAFWANSENLHIICEAMK